MKEKFPKLKIWSITFIIFILIQSIFYIFQPIFKNSIDNKIYFLKKAQSIYLLDYIKKNINLNKKVYRVVVIGSSLTEFGVDCREVMSTYSNQKIDVYKIYARGNNLELFTKESNIFGSILKLKPDLVCIESDLMTSEIFFYLQKNLIADLAQKNKDAMYNFYLIISSALNNSIPNPEICNNPYVMKVKSEELNFYPRKVRTFESNSFVHPYLKEYKIKGIKTVLLHFPRPNEIEVKIHTGDLEKELKNLLIKYDENFGIKYWKFPNPLSNKYFYDQGHFNTKGRELYSKWLIKKILGQIEK
jgi:hypothetical protein